MHHPYIDVYAGLNSPLHKLDARVKILAAAAIILFVVLTPEDMFYSFLLYGILLAVLAAFSGIPPLYIIKRSLVIIPFVLMIGVFIPFFKAGTIAREYSLGVIRLTVTYEGLAIFRNILIKSILSIICLIIFVSATRYSALLKGLERLKIPRLFVMILLFMYRYLFVIVDELMMMKRAKDSRTVNCPRIYNFKALGNMLGLLFIRSYERAERVYTAMLSRGFNGTVRTLNESKIKTADVVFSSVIFIYLTAARMITVTL
jgi:cobalt/nickel transport system permease protein